MTDTGADSQNVVGNELFRGGATAQIAVGNGYRFLGSDHFAYGNRTEAQGLQPEGTASLPEVSYYLENVPIVMPDWWTLAADLPVTGPEHDLATAKNNPADPAIMNYMPAAPRMAVGAEAAVASSPRWPGNGLEAA